MSRVGLVVAVLAALLGVTLAGCSGSMPSLPDWMTPSVPDWMSFGSSPPPPVTLRFESDPQGADVRTSQGQTCQTPCALAVPPQSQSVTFAKNGFLPMTIQVTVAETGGGSFFEAPQPALTPNPVQVALQPIPPPPRGGKRPPPRPRHTVSNTQAPPPPPPGQPPAGSAFPPPPRQ